MLNLLCETTPPRLIFLLSYYVLQIIILFDDKCCLFFIFSCSVRQLERGLWLASGMFREAMLLAADGGPSDLKSISWLGIRAMLAEVGFKIAVPPVLRFRSNLQKFKKIEKRKN